MAGTEGEALVLGVGMGTLLSALADDSVTAEPPDEHPVATVTVTTMHPVNTPYLPMAGSPASPDPVNGTLLA